MGQVVPADVKVVSVMPEGGSFKLDQSMLTGEALPVTKYVGSEMFAGSTVKAGDGEAVVFATGVNTFFGKTSMLTFEEPTPKVSARCLTALLDEAKVMPIRIDPKEFNKL